MSEPSCVGNDLVSEARSKTSEHACGDDRRVHEGPAALPCAMAKLVWTQVAEEGRAIEGRGHKTLRAKVPGGWLVGVWMMGGGGVTFVPDPQHSWDVEEMKDPRAQ
jgi:hypothetical protein